MFKLMMLPYAPEALEPYMSAKTINFHYGKHHQAYLDNLNKLIAGTEYENLALEEIVVKTANQSDKAAIFNNAAQVYNHNIFWETFCPKGSGGDLSEELLEAINKSFGSLENFLTEFKTLAMSQFGSGWTWLVKSDDGLKIIKTQNAENPLSLGLKPIIAIDVWEHSYYLDYQNKRADYLDALLNNVIDWQKASERFIQS